MMKSEWDPLKSKPDIKQRLNSLFGTFDRYSEFNVKTRSAEETTATLSSLPSEIHTTEIESPLLNGEQQTVSDLQNGNKNKEERAEKEQINGQNSLKNDLDDIIGQLVNVSKPLSPIPSVRIISENMALSATGGTNNNNETNLRSADQSECALGIELEAIIQQITCVAPLISPIHCSTVNTPSRDANSNDGRKRPISCSTQFEDQLKRPKNCNERKEQTVETRDGQKVKSEEHYKIKLSVHNFIQLIERKEIRNKTLPKTMEDCKGIIEAEKDIHAVNKSTETMLETVSEEYLTKSLKQCMPSSSFRIENNKHLPVDHFLERARDLKKSGNGEKEKVKQILYCFESVAFYIMASTALVSKPDKMYSSITDTVNFLNSSWTSFKNNKTVNSPTIVNYVRITFKTVQLMVSSCLAYHLYSLRSEQVLRTYSRIQRYEKENPQNHKRPTSRGGTLDGNGGVGTTTSPTESTGLNRSSNPPMVSLPMDIYTSMSQQLRTLHHLMWSNKLWKDAVTSAQSAENQIFVEGLNTLCGELKYDSELADVAEFLLTSTYWMRNAVERSNKTKEEQNEAKQHNN